MVKDPSISFCIVSFNSQDLLKECLSSLLGNSPRISSEVIVVDNHSTDRSVEMIQSDFPDVVLEILDSSISYTQAMNRAMKKAKGRFLVQLNPDTLIKPGVWDALIGFMNSHQNVGICTPKILNRDGTLQKQCRRSSAGPWDTFCYMSGLSRLFPDNRKLAGYLMTYMDENAVHPRVQHRHPPVF